MRIGIVGAGAIGGLIGVSMGAHGHELSVLARGETLAALRQGAWRLTRGREVIEAPARASDEATELGVQDIVILALKAPALRGIAPRIAPLLGADTIVIPAMNGVPWWFLLAGAGDLPPSRLASVDQDGTIASVIPFESVLGCVVHVAASVAAPGCAVHNSGSRIIVGEPRGGRSARLAIVAEALAHAGFDAVISERIRRDLWYKLWGNMTMNPISAVTGATCDRILDDELVNDFVLRVMTEAAAIGARIGCEIEERGEDRNKVTRQLGALRTSMLQDVAAGRPLELDALLSAPCEIGRRLSIATPNMDSLLGLTRLFGRVRGLYPD
jgi:2-dehydropantoate 2-reductase